MKKTLFSIIFSFLLAHVATAQTSPLAPQSKRAKVWNSTILYKMFKGTYEDYVNIPVYLSTPRNVSIQYCWYKTQYSFGEKVRLSEEPERIEEGTYTNGRLTTYKKNGLFYTLQWSPSGEISSITKYNSSGSTSGSYTLSDMRWVDFESAESNGKGLSSSTSIHISNVLLEDKYESKECVRLTGYYISSGYLCYKIVLKSLGKVRGQLAKGWRNDSRIDELRKINADGSLGGSKCFDFNDPARCSYFEF